LKRFLRNTTQDNILVIVDGTKIHGHTA